MDAGERGILAVARSVFEQLDVDQVLERILEAARELTGARYAALGVLGPERTHLGRFLTAGVDDLTRHRIGPPPTGRGVLGELIRDPRPLRLEDVSGHEGSYGFPAEHPPMHSFLGVPIIVADAPYGNLYLTEKPDGPFTADDEEAAVALARFAGLAIDHARRYTTTEDERAQLERSVQALDATLQISQAVSGEADLARILSLVAARGRELVAARLVLIELARGEELELAAGAGEVPDGLLGRRLPLEGTVAEAALATGETQSLTDPVNRTRFMEHGAGLLGVVADHGLIVPLVFRERRYGVLVAFDSLYGGFDADHQRLLESFAASAATAVAMAGSVADERRRQSIAAAEAERGRWARELHDETLQALGSLRLVLSSARRRADPERLATAVDEALEQLDLDISSLRALITELRPAALDQLGLEAALTALSERTRHTGLEVEENIQLAFESGQAGTERLPAELETAIYRIVQEALTNAAKHGRATRVQMEVLEGPSLIRIVVADDGIGFDVDAPRSGFGLAGIHERVDLLDGRLRVSSTPREGTVLTVTLAVDHHPPDLGSGGGTLEPVTEPAPAQPGAQ